MRRTGEYVGEPRFRGEYDRERDLEFRSKIDDASLTRMYDTSPYKYNNSLTRKFFHLWNPDFRGRMSPKLTKHFQLSTPILIQSNRSYPVEHLLL